MNQKFEIENGKLIRYSDVDQEKTVVIPEGVTVIGENAFEFSGNYVKELILPSTLTKLENYSLSGLLWVEKIDIPESVIEIGDGVFFEWYNLKNVTLPRSVKRIKNKAFGSCTLLKTIKVPKDCTLDDGWNEDCNAEIIYY